VTGEGGAPGVATAQAGDHAGAASTPGAEPR
jgi:hypothetical protein